MKGAHGYGRYNDDPQHVGCPRAQSDMTPCVARDGHTAMTSDDHEATCCVGCGAGIRRLLAQIEGPAAFAVGLTDEAVADTLRERVREITEPLTTGGTT